MAPNSNEWKRLVKVKPDEIIADDASREDQYENLGQDFLRLNPNDFDNVDDLKVALRYGQKFATLYRAQRDDVENALEDLVRENDQLKSVAMSDAKNINPILSREIQDLRDKNDELRRANDNSLGEVQELRRQLARSESTIQELRNERESLKKLSDDLTRRIAELRDNTARAPTDGTERTSRVRALERELNKVLDENNQLYADCEKMRSATKTLENQVSDSTKYINDLLSENSKLKSLLTERDDENLKLKNELNLLREQMPSPGADEEDLIMRAVEERVKKWKDAFKAKDDEIDDLNRRNVDLQGQLQMLRMQSPKTDVATLNQNLAERDRQINILKSKLEEATNDLMKVTDALDRVRGGTQADPIAAATRSNAFELNRLKKQLTDYEKELSDRDAQIQDLDKQLRAFLDNNYGLDEAVQEIRQLKGQLKLKDRQLEDVANYASKNELVVHELSDENEELRAKLGMDPKKPMTLDELRDAQRTRSVANQATIQILQKEIEKLEEERLELKRKCRQLAQQAGVKAAEQGLTGDYVWTDEKDRRARSTDKDASRPISAFNDDFQEQFKENEKKLDQLNRELIEKTSENRALMTEILGLEQGLKEVSEQMKQIRLGKGSSAGQGPIVLQCPSLEKMLQVLETQRIAGRYDNAMMMKSENDMLMGRLAELRDELHKARQEKNRAEFNLKEANEKLSKYQRDLKLFEDAGAVPLQFQSMRIPEGTSPSSRDIIAALNEYLVDALAEVTAQREMNQQLEEGLEKYRRKFNVIKHQTGLLYKDFHEKQQQWINERDQNNEMKRDLQTEIEKNLVQLQEYNRLLDTLEQDDVEVRRRVAEVTRKITVLRVNEKALARKILSYQDIETRLRKDNTKLRSEVVEMEVAVQNRLNYLQRYKDTSAYRIKHLQKQVEESVHQTEFDKLNRKYEDIVEKYRDLLEQQHNYVQQTEQSSALADENRKLNDEIEFLRRQLQIDKEKLHLMEETLDNLKTQGLINAGYSSNRSREEDFAPGSLASRLTVLEMKELNERQRAEYAQKLYDQQRNVLRQMEDRNLELEKKFSDLTRMNLEMQRTERQLREDLVHSVPRSVSDADKKRISELEAIEIQSKQEIGRLREISDVAAFQVTAINDMKALDEKEFQSLRLQVLDLQSKTDEKSEIGKLHRHILALQISEATAKRKLLLAENDLAKQKALLLRSEQKLDEKEQSLFYVRQEYTQRIRYLRTALQDYRHKYAGALPLHVQESYSKTMMELRNGKKQLDLQMKTLAEQKHDLELQIASYEFKQKSLEELISTLKDGQSNVRVQKLLEWQQKFEKVKLNEMRHIRLNKRLESENGYLNQRIKQLEIDLTQVEEQNAKFEKEIEERQLIWEHREMDLEKKIDQLEKQQTDIAHAAKRFEEAMGNYPDPSLPVAHQLEQALGIIRENIHLLMEAKIQQQLIEKKTTEHHEKIQEMENAILARDKVIHELRLRLPTTTILDSDKIVSDIMTRPEDFSRLAAVRAAQTTIDSLQERLAQKEESLRKYQELLKEAREDLNKQTRQHEEELIVLNEQLQNKRDLDFIRLKEFVAQGGNLAHLHGTPSTFELSRLREFEENAAVQENTIAHLNEKLREARREAEQWKTRLAQKMEQFKQEREKIKSTYDKIVEELNRQIEEQRAQLQEQLNKVAANAIEPETKSSPNKGSKSLAATRANLQEQLALKEEQCRNLIRALADIRSNMVKIAEGNLRAFNEDEKQNLSIEALIATRTAEWKEKVDEAEKQIEQLKQELKKQKTFARQVTDEATDLREKLAQNEKKLVKLQQQNAALADNAQRRAVGQQVQQNQGDETVESLRRQIRLLEDKLRKTRTAERPLDEPKDERTRRVVESLQQQVTDLDTHKKELLKFNQQLKDELTKVRLRNEELQKINNYLKAENENLRNGESPRSSSSGSIRRIGDSGRSTVELEKIIAMMKKRIDALQTENQNLKSDLDRQRIENESNRAFFTQATESTKDIEQMGLINSRLQKEVALLREQIGQMQVKALPRSASNGFK